MIFLEPGCEQQQAAGYFSHAVAEKETLNERENPAKGERRLMNRRTVHSDQVPAVRWHLSVGTSLAWADIDKYLFKHYKQQVLG